MSRQRFLVSLATLFLTLSPVALPASQASARVIEISAERFEFWPAEIGIGEGEHVELRIRSEDTAHGFRIFGTSVNLTVPKRGKGVAVIPFVGPKAGRYTFECSRMCGAGHNFMRGVLIVRPVPAGTRP
jgi:cytochrome c oxidase subunit 2